MFGNSRNPKRLSINAGVGSLVSRWRSIFIALVLVLMIGNTGQISTVQAAPTGTTELRFFMIANKKGASKPICIGERVPIQVLVYRLKLVNGVSEAPEVVTGASVTGVVENPNIGQISPTQNTTEWAGSSIYPGAADFVFIAENAGETIIRFAGIVATPGWFGTNWKGGAQSFSATVAVKVIPCKFKVEATSYWNNNVRGIYLATMDETEIKADADGHYTGSASVNWTGTFMMDSCPKEYIIPTGQVNLSGELSDTGQLTATLTYQPVPVTFDGACGNLSGWDNFEVSQNPMNFSVPASGGTFTRPQVLTGSGEMGIFDGSVVIVVTPLMDEAVAFTSGNHNHQVNWYDFLSLFGVLFSFR